MQVETETGAPIEFTHTLGEELFYFRNPFTNKTNGGNGLAAVSKTEDPLNYHHVRCSQSQRTCLLPADDLPPCRRNLDALRQGLATGCYQHVPGFKGLQVARSVRWEDGWRPWRGCG